jgi:hypothetical protein
MKYLRQICRGLGPVQPVALGQPPEDSHASSVFRRAPVGIMVERAEARGGAAAMSITVRSQ